MFADVKPSEVFASVASAGSLAVTAYFWLVRMRGERPRLATHLVEVVKVDAARSFDSGWDPLITIRVAIVNLSTLPNVVLGARAQVRKADGTWAAAAVRVSGGADVFNVAPQVAEFREVWIELPQVAKPAMPDAEWSQKSWREVLEPALGGRIVLRVELITLGGKTFADELTAPAFAV